VASLKTLAAFREHCRRHAIALEADDALEADEDAPLARPLVVDGLRAGNRLCVLPMEGWDGTPDGAPSDLTLRRWRRFGESGAGLIWGGEAVAVRHDGRANPNQLVLTRGSMPAIAALRRALVAAHEERHGTASAARLLVGLQLTHSGRYCRPNPGGRPEPLLAYRHPLLDRQGGVSAQTPVLTDAQIGDLIGDFVAAAVLAQEAGFAFVDVKHCHGYLGHELLSAVERPGAYGGSLANRTRFLREAVAGIRRDAPGLAIGVRLSAIDTLPFAADPETGVGRPEAWHGAYPYAFGANPDAPLTYDLREPRAFLGVLRELGIRLVCLTAGSPYYNPHIQRPAYFPPSDGYRPPEDPLAGVARQIAVTAALKADFPDLAIVGSGYSYLQEYVGHVAQRQVRTGAVDAVGLGRMMLSAPTLAAGLLAGQGGDRRTLCRTFSDCTTAPRNGLVSGCYPLDPFYKARPEAARLQKIKRPAAEG
jgi:2,4-dienoyl-CoA reductase-like NADH-dependent reductase (Old Yellow Enzyme family)